MNRVRPLATDVFAEGPPIDGKMKEVEFWKNPLKAIGNAFKSAGKAIGNAAESGSRVVTQVVQRVGDSVRSLITGVTSAVVGAARNIAL